MRLRCDEYPVCTCPDLELCLDKEQVECIERILEAARDYEVSWRKETDASTRRAMFALFDAIRMFRGKL